MLEHFGVDEHKGLSNSRALAAKERHGANELAMGEPEPLWRKMVDQFQDPMSECARVCCVSHVRTQPLHYADTYTPCPLQQLVCCWALHC